MGPCAHVRLYLTLVTLPTQSQTDDGAPVQVLRVAHEDITVELPTAVKAQAPAQMQAAYLLQFNGGASACGGTGSFLVWAPGWTLVQA